MGKQVSASDLFRGQISIAKAATQQKIPNMITEHMRNTFLLRDEVQAATTQKKKRLM